MLPLILICISLLITIFSLLKSKEKKSKITQTAELESYYNALSEETTAQQLVKHLLSAATAVTEKIQNLEEERYVLYNLNTERMISPSLWKEAEDNMAHLKFEKMTIEAEADGLKPGLGEEIFRDAERNVRKNANSKEVGKKEKRINEDMLFYKKKEMLERELIRRIKGC